MATPETIRWLPGPTRKKRRCLLLFLVRWRSDRELPLEAILGVLSSTPAQMLSQADLINAQADRAFLLRAQYPFGGFGKEPEDTPDPYHSYLAIAALSMHEHRDQTRDSDLGLGKLDPAWNVRTETADWLRGEVARIKGKIP